MPLCNRVRVRFVLLSHSGCREWLNLGFFSTSRVPTSCCGNAHLVEETLDLFRVDGAQLCSKGSFLFLSVLIVELEKMTLAV